MQFSVQMEVCMKIGLLTFVVTMFSAPLAAAEKLGDMGTVAISGNLGAAASTFDRPPITPMKQWAFGGSMTMDRFVTPQLSVGLGLSGSYGHARFEDERGHQTMSARSMLGSLRFGYLIPLSERAAFWPVAHVGVLGEWRHTRGPNGHLPSPMDHVHGIRAGVDVQLTYAISDHLYLRATPGGVRATIARFEEGSARSVMFSFNGACLFGLGGWF